jgi:hypothetical protein
MEACQNETLAAATPRDQCESDIEMTRRKSIGNWLPAGQAPNAHNLDRGQIFACGGRDVSPFCRELDDSKTGFM